MTKQELQAQLDSLESKIEGLTAMIAMSSDFNADQKQWVLDSTLRTLLGQDEYDNFRTLVGKRWNPGTKPPNF